MSDSIPKNTAPRHWTALAGFLLASFLVEIIGGWVTAGAVRDWYPILVKPGFTPPNWLFGPVWTLLYVLMAVAAWRVWNRSGPGPRLWLYGAQLALNLAWTLIFFGLKAPLIGMIEIAILWVAVLACTRAFFQVDGPAGWLLVPYLAWTSYAAALNIGIVVLNP